VHCTDVESAQKAFGLNGLKFGNAVIALTFEINNASPFSYDTEVSSEAIGRLAVAHLELMREGKGFSCPKNLDPSCFFGVVPYVKHTDTLLSTRPVTYQWVFEHAGLMTYKGFTERLLTDTGAGKELNTQEIGLYRRIFHLMFVDNGASVQRGLLRGRYDEFFKTVLLGMTAKYKNIMAEGENTVVKGSGHIVFDLEKFCVVHHNTGIKFCMVGNAIDNSFLSTINKILIDKLSIRSFCY
jgi:hypothetical protein